MPTSICYITANGLVYCPLDPCHLPDGSPPDGFRAGNFYILRLSLLKPLANISNSLRSDSEIFASQRKSFTQ